LLFSGKIFDEVLDFRFHLFFVGGAYIRLVVLRLEAQSQERQQFVVDIPGIAQRILRIPREPGTTTPDSAFSARKASNGSRASSVRMRTASRMNLAVSTTVTGDRGSFLCV